MIIAFDVDGTLIHRTDDSLVDVPREEVISLYFAFQNLGFEMWVWSGGGADYARRWADALDLRPDWVFAKSRDLKPHIAVDDVDGADLGTVATIIIPPNGGSRVPS